MSIKTTPLIDCHRELGACLVEFAGTLLPVRYTSEKEEHLAVRKSIGMFDVSHMGEFLLNGPAARPFLQKLLTNNINKLNVGQAHYSLMLNTNGGIIDDLIVYQLGEDNFMLCVNAANIAKDWEWIREQARSSTELRLKNASDDFAQIAVQGPKAMELLNTLIIDTLPERFTCKNMKIAGIEALVAHTGYTGEAGVEIFIAPSLAPTLWHQLLDAGKNFSLKPCGLAARDSLRLEAGMLLHGTDMDELTTPLEAGLAWAVDLSKNEFIGKPALMVQKTIGPSKKLVGFRLLDRGIARHGFTVLNKAQELIGEVSSGSWPPGHETAIGFAYIKPTKAKLGDEIIINIRDRPTRALVTKPRFI